MPVIEFPEDERSPEFMIPTITALMLSPDDESLRMTLMKRERVHSFSKLAAVAREPQIDFDQVVSLHGMLLRIRDAMDANIPMKKIHRRFLRGAVSGLLLHEVVGRGSVLPRTATLSNVKRQVAKGISGPPFFVKISVSTIDNTIWPRFRPISPLWAAYVSEAFAAGYRGEKPSLFPCHPYEIGNFLARAEHYRRLGEGFVPSQSSRPVLNSNETWRVPDDLEIRTVSFGFHRAA